MSDERRGVDLQFLLGLFIGGLIGAFLIFFMGTKEGKKTKKLLEQKGEDTLDDIHDQIDALEQKGKEIVEQGQEIKEQVIEQLEDKKEELTERATEKLDTALAQVEKIQEEGLSSTSDLRKRIFKNVPSKKR